MARCQMVNAGDRISPLKSLLILATYLFAFTGLAHSQMGIGFDKCVCKDEFENVKEFKEMGKTFTSAELNDKKNGLKTIYTFYNGKLVRVKFARSDDSEWSEDLAHRLWEKWFNNDNITSREELFDKEKKKDGFIKFSGRDGNQLVLGRGFYKSSLLLESSIVTAMTDKYVQSKVGKSKTTVADDDQYQPLIPLPWQKRVTKEEYMKRRAADDLRDDNQRADNQRAFINYTDGTSGRVSSQGAVSDMYGQQKGWVDSSGFIRYNDGTSGRISPNGAVYNMYGQQTGWAQ
jgi:hypothetical protein